MTKRTSRAPTTTQKSALGMEKIPLSRTNSTSVLQLCRSATASLRPVLRSVQQATQTSGVRDVLVG